MEVQESTIQDTEVLEDQQNWEDGWNDDESSVDDHAGEERGGTEPKQEDPAQEPEAEEVGTETGAEAAPADQRSAAEEQPFLTLKHLDETRNVTREEAQALAQKGMDYDRVRERMDSYKKELDEARPALTLVKQYADAMKLSVSEYLDYCRTQELVSGGMTEEQAKHQVNLDKRDAELSAKEEAARQAEQERTTAQNAEKSAQERQRQDFNDFIRRFPNVKAEDIPQSVWESVNKGESLVMAYTMDQLNKATAEVAALKASEEARKRTPGSLQKTEHKPAGDADPYDADWYGDD